MATTTNNDIILSNSSQRYPPQDTIISSDLRQIRNNIGALENEYIYVPFVKFIINNTQFPVVSWKGTLVEDTKTTDIIVHSNYKGPSNTLITVSDSNTVVVKRLEVIDGKNLDTATIYWKSSSNLFSIIVDDTYPSAFDSYRGNLVAFLEVTTIGSLRTNDSSYNFEDTGAVATDNIWEGDTYSGDISLNLRSYNIFIIHAIPPPSIVATPFITSVPVITEQPSDITTIKLGEKFDETKELFSITATSPENIVNIIGEKDGILSYEWFRVPTKEYSNGVSVGTTQQFSTTFNTIGTFYFYCKIINKIKVLPNPSILGNISETNILSKIYEVRVEPITKASNPIIIEQPQDATYELNMSSKNLNVQAISPDPGGKLTYQWWYTTSSGIISTATAFRIDGATTPSYKPSTLYVQSRYFFCEILNTVQSQGNVYINTEEILTVPAYIEIKNPNPVNPHPDTPSLRYSSIVQEEYTVNESKTSPDFLVEVTLPDLGSKILSYQWYVTKNINSANMESNSIKVKEENTVDLNLGADYGTNAYFNPRTNLSEIERNEAIDNNGFITFYYYCKVTNTSPLDSTLQASMKSNIIKVNINPKRQSIEPNIKYPLTPETYGAGSMPTHFTILATAGGAGELAYQWYKIENWDSYPGLKGITSTTITLIDGIPNIGIPILNEKSTTYYPPTQQDNIGYFCLVTNTTKVYKGANEVVSAKKVSNAVRITIREGAVSIKLNSITAGTDYKFYIYQEQSKINGNFNENDTVVVNLLLQGDISTPKGRYTEWELIEQIKNRSIFMNLMSFKNDQLVLTQYLTNIVFRDDQINKTVGDPNMENEYSSPTSFIHSYSGSDPDPDPVPTGVLLYITLAKPPTKVIYEIGEELNLLGIEVTGKYSDGRTLPEKVNLDNITGYDNQTLGSQELSVTITGSIVKFSITVIEPIDIYVDWQTLTITKEALDTYGDSNPEDLDLITNHLVSTGVDSNGVNKIKQIIMDIYAVSNTNDLISGTSTIKELINKEIESGKTQEISVQIFEEIKTRGTGYLAGWKVQDDVLWFNFYAVKD